MPALSNPTLWRTRPYRYKGYLYIDRPTAILSARVNQSTFTYPLTSVTYDTATGDYLDIRPGMLITFGSTSGGNDLGRVYAHDTAATTTELYFGRVSRGDKDGEVSLADNAYITVWDFHPVFAKTPYIDEDTGTQYKWGTVEVGTGSSNNAQYPPPVANIGPSYGKRVSSGVIVVEFDATLSEAVAPSASIAHFYWEVGDGTVLIGSAGSASPGTTGTNSITVQFPAGRRYVYLTVTDTNGRSHTANALIVGVNTTTFKDIERFEVQRQTLTPSGQDFSVLVKEDIDLSTYPDGAMVLYWEDEWYGDTLGSLAGYAGREHMKFIGYIQSESVSTAYDADGKNAGVVLNCVDVAGRLKTLPAFSQTVARSATASTWFELRGANIDRMVWYLLHWHSSALEVADFNMSGQGDTYQFFRLVANAGNLWDQADGRCDAIDFRLACDRQGRITMQPDNLNIDPATRSLDITIDLAETDWTAFQYTRSRPPRVNWLWGSGVKASATEFVPYFAVSPGGAPGQGESPQTRGQMLVADQDDLNTRIGQRYARANALFSTAQITLAVAGDGGLDPGLYEGVTITQTSTSAGRRAETWTTSENWLVTGVDIRHDHEAATKEVTVSLERETTGYDAIAYTPPAAELGSNITAQHTTFDAITPAPPETAFDPQDYYNLKPGIDNIASFNSDGYVYITTDWTSETPTWARTNLSLTGEAMQFVADPFSPKYSAGTGAVNGWLITTQRIYRITDVFGTVGATSQATLTTLSTLHSRCIAIERGVQNFLLVSSYYHSSGGTKVTVTTDGSTWAAETTLSTGYRTLYQRFPGAWVSGRTAGKAMTTAVDTDNATGRTYWTDDYGATWNWLSGSDAYPDLTDAGLGHGFHIPYGDNASEMRAFHGQIDGSANLIVYRVDSDGDTKTDVTPIDSDSAAYINRAPQQLVTSETNRQKVAFWGSTDTASTNGGAANQQTLFTSTDGGDSWTQRSLTVAVDGSLPWAAWCAPVFMSGADSDVLYICAYQGIYYSNDFGVSVLDKTGNIGSLGTPKTFIGLCGG